MSRLRSFWASRKSRAVVWAPTERVRLVGAVNFCGEPEAEGRISVRIVRAWASWPGWMRGSVWFLVYVLVFVKWDRLSE